MPEMLFMNLGMGTEAPHVYPSVSLNVKCVAISAD